MTALRRAAAVTVAAIGVFGLFIGAVADRQQGAVLLGASAPPRAGEGPEEAVRRIEEQIGRPLGVVRVFERWDSVFPTPNDEWLRDSHHAIFLSVSSRKTDGSYVSWRAVGDAAPGTPLFEEIRSWADRIASFGVPIYFSFDPEPEGQPADLVGGPADFVAAWRRVHQIFLDEGATNAVFVVTLTAATFAGGSGGAGAWYPGDADVDAIGADGYNFFGCRDGRDTGEWRSFADVFDPVRRFGEDHPGEPLMIPEWGSVEDLTQPGRKAEWIDDARRTLRSPEWSGFTVVVYWNSSSGACRFEIDTSPSALEAFAAMGSDPHFDARP